MKLKRLQLLLNVDIDPQGETTEHLKRQLHRVVSNAVNNGLLTGDTAATVERYDYDISERRSVKKKKSVCAVCGHPASTKRKISINNAPKKLCSLCEVHADAVDEDVPAPSGDKE
jgi:hypothetical protein